MQLSTGNKEVNLKQQNIWKGFLTDHGNFWCGISIIRLVRIIQIICKMLLFRHWVTLLWVAFQLIPTRDGVLDYKSHLNMTHLGERSQLESSEAELGLFQKESL